MKKFAAGFKDIRAPERGPEELRSIARQYNDMVDALSRQHENRLKFLAAVAHDLGRHEADAADVRLAYEGGYTAGGWQPIGAVTLTTGRYRVALAANPGAAGLGPAFRVGLEARFK